MPIRKNRKWIPCSSQVPNEGVIVDTRLSHPDGWYDDRPMFYLHGEWYRERGATPVTSPTFWKYKREKSENT